MSYHPELIAAINENTRWIEKKCLVTEWNHAKREELVQDVLFNLIKSNSNFIAQKDVNATAWVKRIATNVTSKYVQNEMREKSFFNRTTNDLSQPSQTTSPEIHDLRIVSEFISKNFSEKDREIMNLHLMNEVHADIAVIMGLSVATITNKIAILRKQLNEHFNQDIV